MHQIVIFLCAVSKCLHLLNLLYCTCTLLYIGWNQFHYLHNCQNIYIKPPFQAECVPPILFLAFENNSKILHCQLMLYIVPHYYTIYRVLPIAQHTAAVYDQFLFPFICLFIVFFGGAFPMLNWDFVCIEIDWMLHGRNCICIFMYMYISVAGNRSYIIERGIGNRLHVHTNKQFHLSWGGSIVDVVQVQCRWRSK